MPRSAESLVADALTRVHTLSVQEAQAWMQSPDVLCLDIREPAEWVAQGVIAGAHPVPRGVLEFAVDPASPWHRPALAPQGRRLLLYCGVGWRSALAADSLQRLELAPVAHLAGGFEAWRAAGGAVKPWSPPGSEPKGGP